MAFGTPVVGTVAYSANGGTSVAPGYPSGILATDQLVMFVGMKPSTANGGTLTQPTGWTIRDVLTGAGGYGTTLGADSGNTNLWVLTKNTVTAGQTGTQSVTIGTNNVSWAFIVRVPTGGGTISYGSSDGQDTTAGNVSVTLAANPGLTAGDFAIWAMCIPTDVTTPSQFSAHAISATGATFATPAELNEPDSGTGNDIGGFSAWTTVSSGTASVAPTVTATAGGTTTNVRGPVVFLRMREAAAISFNAESTSYSLTGQDATLSRSRSFNAESTSFAVTGQDATLVYTPAAVNIDFDAEVGSFSLTGQAATLSVGRRLALDSGTFVLTGQAATLTAARRLSADAGAYTLAGQDATLLTGTPFRELDAEDGAFTLTGQAATLVAARRLSADAGAYTLTGQAAALSVSRALDAQPGSFSLTGQNATLSIIQTNTTLDAQPGSFIVTGAFATLAVSRILRADAGAYRDSSWADPDYVDPDYAAGTSATLGYSRVKALSPGALAITGASASLVYAQPVSLSPEQKRLLFEIYLLHGLADPLVVGPTSRSAGALTQAVVDAGGTVTVTRTAPSTASVPDIGTMIEELAALHGLGETLSVTATSRSAGAINQSMVSVGGVTTVTRI